MRTEAALLVLCAAVAGCSLAPDYQPPAIRVPEAFKETGPWTRGIPQDALPGQAWWRLYGDETLNGLEARVEAGNPALAVALARYDAAQGYLEEAQSAVFPAVAAGGHATANRQSDHRPLRGASQPRNYGDNLVGAAFTWDIDLWGRVRNQVAAGEAEAQASFADLQSIRLSLQAQLADGYLRLRGLDAHAQLLRDTIDLYRRALELTDERHQKGVASGLDVGRAQAQLADARAQLADVQGRRALLEHAIASLTGQAPSDFAIAPAAMTFKIPNVPPHIPSTLLQRRPDIAAAERRVAASNAGIGVARAAFFPDVSLNALGGFQNTGSNPLFTAPDALWSLGPSAVFTVFDAGRHEGQLTVAKAENRAAAADYRADVLRAFQEVEDNLALLNRLAEQAEAQAESVAAATRTRDLSLALYKNGALGFLDVVVAQTTALTAQQAALTIQTRRLAASVALIRAIGGGWSSGTIPALAGMNGAGERQGLPCYGGQGGPDRGTMRLKGGRACES